MILEITDADFEELKKSLVVAKCWGDPKPEGSIMTYKAICTCDDAFLCEDRREWIINWIKSKEKK